MLRSCFDPCFRLMLAFREAPRPDAPSSGADLLREARSLLDAAADRARASFPAEAVETARRMVEAWMDEVALADPWEGREVWLADPLQSRWKEGKGGEWFFDVAGHLSPDKPHDAELAEVPCAASGSAFAANSPTTSGPCAVSTASSPPASGVTTARRRSRRPSPSRTLWPPAPGSCSPGSRRAR